MFFYLMFFKILKYYFLFALSFIIAENIKIKKFNNDTFNYILFLTLLVLFYSNNIYGLPLIFSGLNPKYQAFILVLIFNFSN